MALQPFSFPSPETRFFKAGSLIYKFKIKGGNSFSEDDVLEEDSVDQEMEEIVRAVLGDLDGLQPFTTPHYTVFPYKKSWRKVSKRNEKKLLFYPFVIILYLEKNMCKGKPTENSKETQLIPDVSEEPRPKRRRSDSPLEEAIIKEMWTEMEYERHISVPGVAESERHRTAQEAVDDSAPTDELQTTHFTPETERRPEKAGILRRLVRNIFPFIFGPPEN
ncbi:membrane-anchored junction protein [Fundulus heteroclitus]|uniref:membrane-anchored junction protein n=1 Tax=Fundulus heteroclitus TaxID=8078 RepID=UPI00165BFE35|nr:membrane-anchored junction protein [Fundulus heteroclitus]XP_036002820.1 membrane-anchored junction protein [Fundulus heteroclitus]